MNIYVITFPNNYGLKLFTCIVARNTDFNIKIMELETSCFVKCSESVYNKLKEFSEDEYDGFPAMFHGALPIKERERDDAKASH